MVSLQRNFLVILIVLIITSGVIAACNIDISDFRVELRSEQDGYASTIYAENNSQVHVRIIFNIDNVSGTNCANNIGARAEIYRWNSNNNDWDRVRTTTTKTQALEEDIFFFTWSNEFAVSNNYERYKVKGIIREGNNEVDVKNAFIDVENNTCTGIVLRTSDFEINENQNQRRYFYIENNTNRQFNVSNAEVTFTVSGITSGNVNYPNIISRNSTGNVEVNLTTGTVSSDRTVTGRFRVNGYLDNDFCSFTAIGEKTFDVRIRDTGSTTPPVTSPSGVCGDLELITKNFEMNEASTNQKIFYLKNNSTRRFEILEVKTTGSGVNLEAFYLEKYAFPNNLANIVVKANSPNVTQNRIYEGKLEVRGRFSDGRTCSFSQIGERKFNITVNNTTSTNLAPMGCEGFNISTPNEVILQNAGSAIVTITNGSNRTANVYVESNLEVSPTLISLPANSSITREITINAIRKSGNIILRPQITGCNVPSKTIIVTNTATGELGQVTINHRIEENNGKLKLLLEFNNPSTKFFVGVLGIDASGWVSEDKTITIPPGESFTEIIIEPVGQNQARTGIIRFNSNGKEIAQEIKLADEEPFFAGLFGLGANAFGIALIAIILIIAIALTIYIINNDNGFFEEEITEPWQMEKN